MQGIRAGTALSLLHRVKFTVMTNINLLPQTFCGSRKLGRKGRELMCVGRAEQFLCLRPVKSKWALGVLVRGWLAATSALTGAHTAATNDIVSQTLVFTFKMIKLSPHRY